jgi:hypothetical protein
VLILMCVIRTYFRAMQTTLKVVGHHHASVRPKLTVIGHFVGRPCKRYFKACLSINSSKKCLNVHIFCNKSATGHERVLTEAPFTLYRINFHTGLIFTPMLKNKGVYTMPLRSVASSCLSLSPWKQVTNIPKFIKKMK